MDQPVCPACKAENEEDAAYCDQCGQHLVEPDAAGEGAEDGCPACGGLVESRGDGKGVCSRCGLELVEETEAAAAPVSTEGAALSALLTAAILKKAQSGLTLDRAVADACREVLAGVPAPSGAAPAAPPAAAAAPCPLCGVENEAKASRCSGCGIWYGRLRAPVPCPRCDRPVQGDGHCSCGAIVTLPKLLEYIEPKVRFVCSRCRAPYAVPQPKCPDCGGGLISADRIKAFAAEN